MEHLMIIYLISCIIIIALILINFILTYFKKGRIETTILKIILQVVSILLGPITVLAILIIVVIYLVGIKKIWNKIKDYSPVDGLTIIDWLTDIRKIL